jgi:threonine dehydrogenase-like Zn-dependent dehydrogenase
MKAVLIDEGPHVEQVPDPALTEGTVLVRVHVSAITGMDIDVIRGRKLYRGSPGSGFVGTIIDAEGREARRLIGCRVVGRSSYGCGHCDSCRAGSEYRCVDRVRPGHLGMSGAHAEKVVLPTRAVVPIPETISDAAGALLPMLAGVYSGLWRANLPNWTNILVVGDGGMGLLAALAYASAGYTVTVRGKHGNRFDICRRHNIHFNLVTDDPEVRGQRPGRFGPALVSYPYIVEATGHASGWDAALSLASPGATVFMLSSCLDGVPRPLSPVQEKNLQIIGLREGPIEPVLQIVASGLFDPAEVVTTTFDLDDAPEAYAKAATHREWIPLLRMAS